MKIKIEITGEPLKPPGGDSPGGICGAVVEFAGIVRGEEDGGFIQALYYEAYESMARAEMERILRGLEREFSCEAVHVIHRVGRVRVGEAAIIVRVEARHRAGAFGMLSAFMDRLKTEVPIWKLSS